MEENMNMKVWILLVVTWLVCCNSSTRVESSENKVSPIDNYNNNNNFTLTYNTVRFLLDDCTVEDFSTFLTNIRDQVKSGQESHGIPILYEKSKIPNGKEYLLVDLTSQGVTVTMTIQAVNLYFVAYKIGTTSYFFSDFTNLKSVLFTETKPNQISLSFSSSYTTLPNRENVDIGIPALRDAISKLPKYGQSGVDIRASIVTIIEMVSEISRFTLIQRAVERNFFQRIRPTTSIISFENSWDKLSTQIQRADANGNFKEPVVVKKSDGSDFVVTNVSQVKREIALLLYVNVKSSLKEDTFLGVMDQEEWLPMIR